MSANSDNPDEMPNSGYILLAHVDVSLYLGFMCFHSKDYVVSGLKHTLE